MEKYAIVKRGLGRSYEAHVKRFGLSGSYEILEVGVTLREARAAVRRWEKRNPYPPDPAAKQK